MGTSMHTTRERLVLTLLLATSVVLAPSLGGAKEDAIRFLNELKDAGHGEAGVAYLENFQKQGKLPRELEETFDLEMSECLQKAAQEAFNPEEAQKLLAKSEELS